MKATEVRIGNYVNLITNVRICSGKVIAIKASIIVLQFNEKITRELEDWTLDPIPLTEEILEKVFNLQDNENINGDEELEKISIYSFRIRDYIVMDIPKYVHELQNIYFALTGEELEVSGILTQRILK